MWRQQADVLGEGLQRGAAPLGGALDLVGGDGERLARREYRLALGERGQPDLRALQVGEHADRPAHRGGRLAHQLQPAHVFGVVAMRHVQPDDVDAGVQQSDDPFQGVRGRAQGCNDLCSAHAWHTSPPM